MQREIVVPETKPATEWILGRPVQKVSPKRLIAGDTFAHDALPGFTFAIGDMFAELDLR